MSVAKSMTFQSVLAVCALAFLGPWCLKAKAADREISINRFSFPLSALDGRRLALPCPTHDHNGLLQFTRIPDPKGNLFAFVAPYSVCTARLGNWVTETMNKFETWLSNRTHMIQFCAIGMVLALIIIWWRKT